MPGFTKGGFLKNKQYDPRMKFPEVKPSPMQIQKGPKPSLIPEKRKKFASVAKALVPKSLMKY